MPLILTLLDYYIKYLIADSLECLSLLYYNIAIALYSNYLN